MLVFIDESGDAGFKLDRGSSNVFAVAMVMFEDHQQAQEIAVALGDLRDKWSGVQEFKFSKASADLRDEFFNTALNFDFAVRALVVDFD